MLDAENLNKLISHLPPPLARSLLIERFKLEIPALDDHAPKQVQREMIFHSLAALSLDDRQTIEREAERILQLTDQIGRDVMAGHSTALTPVEKETFSALPNQFERAVWLFMHAAGVFEQALQSRLADLLHQSRTFYTGFVAPKALALKDDTDALATFHSHVAEHLDCKPEYVAVKVFQRVRSLGTQGQEVVLYQISIHYNLPPELEECVENSDVVSREHVRAINAHITYEPTNGSIEVLSRNPQGRDSLARLAADDLLQSPITGERIPIKRYDYQSLATPRSFDITGEPVDWVKITLLQVGNRTGLTVTSDVKEVQDIYQIAKTKTHNPNFDFSLDWLTAAQITIRLRKVGRERAHNVVIAFRGANACNNKAKREPDRALCDRLLERWGLVHAVNDVHPAHALAA